MAYGLSDTSGTDDDLPPPHRNRFQRGGGVAGSGRAVAVGSAQLPRLHGNMATQIHLIEQEAYCAVLRAFIAQSDAISWEQESLITELRKELHVTDEEHREILSRVNSDSIIKRIRECRKTGGVQSGMVSSQPFSDPVPSPTVSGSRKKHRASQSAASLSLDAPSPGMQPSSSILRRGPHSAKSKKPKTSMQQPSAGPGRAPVPRGALGALAASGRAEPASVDPLVGRKVWTRWPDDNQFYEAVITDYNPSEGRHALVYDMNTANETWEWVNLKEISPEDIRWEGEDPGTSRRGPRPSIGHGVKKSIGQGGITGTGRGRGGIKGHAKKDFRLSHGKKAVGDIKLLQSDTLIREVEKVIAVSHPNPTEIEKAEQVLKDQEQALVDAIAKLQEASDGESDEEMAA